MQLKVGHVGWDILSKRKTYSNIIIINYYWHNLFQVKYKSEILLHVKNQSFKHFLLKLIKKYSYAVHYSFFRKISNDF